METMTLIIRLHETIGIPGSIVPSELTDIFLVVSTVHETSNVLCNNS